MSYETYTTVDWLMFFYIYCFLGWCFESTYVSIQHKKWINRGFMRGPFLPLYGSGAVIMLFVTIPVRDNVFLTFLFGAVGATILEYFTGAAMEALFKVRYWDYSNNRFNLNGHICLGTTIAWGFLTLAMVHILQTPVEAVVNAIPPRPEGIIALVVTIYIAADFSLSFKAALDIKDLLAKMTAAKEEMDKSRPVWMPLSPSPARPLLSKPFPIPRTVSPAPSSLSKPNWISCRSMSTARSAVPANS